MLGCPPCLSVYLEKSCLTPSEEVIIILQSPCHSRTQMRLVWVAPSQVGVPVLSYRINQSAPPAFAYLCPFSPRSVFIALPACTIRLECPRAQDIDCYRLAIVCFNAIGKHTYRHRSSGVAVLPAHTQPHIQLPVGLHLICLPMATTTTTYYLHAVESVGMWCSMQGHNGSFATTHTPHPPILNLLLPT